MSETFEAVTKNEELVYIEDIVVKKTWTEEKSEEITIRSLDQEIFNLESAIDSLANKREELIAQKQEKILLRDKVLAVAEKVALMD